jgi:hypothetical protein
MGLGRIAYGSSHAFGVTLLEGRRPAPKAQRSSSEAISLSLRDAPQRRSLLLEAESRSSSGAIIERSAPRTSEGVGDEGGLIWGSRLVGGNQIVKNKDLPPAHTQYLIMYA